MKVMQFTTFGDSGVLQLNEVDKPNPRKMKF